MSSNEFMTAYFTVGMGFVAFILYGVCPPRDARLKRLGTRRAVPFLAIGVVLWPILLVSLVTFWIGGGGDD